MTQNVDAGAGSAESGGWPQQPETTPGVAAADSGEVILDGPDGVAVSMTPEAAMETGRRLVAASDEAARQR